MSGAAAGRRCFLRLAARGGPDMPYRIHTSAGRWTAAAGRHVRNRVQPGVCDQIQASRQANKRFLPQRQNEVHRVPQRSIGAAAVRTGRNDYFTASIAAGNRQQRRARGTFLSFSVAFCVPRSVSVVKIACFKTRDHPAQSRVAAPFGHIPNRRPGLTHV